jgi:hypothetical protein
MNKKTYQSPAVKKVRLNVRASVLGTCRTSVTLDMQGFQTCKLPLGECSD